MKILTVNPGTHDEYEIHRSRIKGGYLLFPTLKTNHLIAVKDSLAPQQIIIHFAELNRAKLRDMRFSEAHTFKEGLQWTVDAIVEQINRAREKGQLMFCSVKTEIVFGELFGINILN